MRPAFIASVVADITDSASCFLFVEDYEEQDIRSRRHTDSGGLLFI
jgi:hypothetical protein